MVVNFRREFAVCLEVETSNLFSSDIYLEVLQQSPILRDCDAFFLGIRLSEYDYSPNFLETINIEFQSLRAINQDNQLPQLFIALIIECINE